MTTITPTKERVRLWVKDRRIDSPRVRYTMIHWLERLAVRQGRHINEPSLVTEFNYDPSVRKTFLYAYADSFPDTMPDWLRTTPVRQGPIILK